MRHETVIMKGYLQKLSKRTKFLSTW